MKQVILRKCFLTDFLQFNMKQKILCKQKSYPSKDKTKLSVVNYFQYISICIYNF